MLPPFRLTGRLFQRVFPGLYLRLPVSHCKTRISTISFNDQPNVRRFDESKTVVALDGDDGQQFECEEEPHVLPALMGGGYFPLQLGDKLESDITGTEYEIVRKLGWGAGSSVWLCHSQEHGYVALKVLTCISSTLIARGQGFELDVCRKLVKAPPGSEHCVKIYESFIAGSRHGGHYCIVMMAHAMSIDQFVRQISVNTGGGLFPFSLDAAKNISRQILLALNCIHSLGFVNTDVKGSNIYMDLGNRDSQAITDFLHKYPASTYEPRVEPSLSPPDPIITVRSEPLSVLGKFEPKTMRVYLGDFGEAVPVEKTAEWRIAMPTALRAPEIILGHTWGTAVDVWAFGCFLFEAITGTWGKIFDLDAPVGMSHTQVHLARMEEMLGPFPKAFIERCSKHEEFFNVNGHLLKSLSGLTPNGSLCQRLARAGLTGSELDRVDSFLHHCLQLDPDLRLSASELIQDQWLVAPEVC